jgi:hypothetical protein
MRPDTPRLGAFLVSALSFVGCGGAEGDTGAGADAGSSGDGRVHDASPPYAENVERFEPGENAGFGADDLPDVVLGPPGGALDVLSLGVGGEIVLGFGDRDLVDGPGADFVVFENPFYVSGDPTRVFAELGEVSVSVDGASWSIFACDVEGAGMGRFPGCAGWTPTATYDADVLVPLDPTVSGGDAFDLAELGVERARFVRIRDLAAEGAGNSAGFDLDAVGAIHLEPGP